MGRNLKGFGPFSWSREDATCDIRFYRGERTRPMKKDRGMSAALFDLQVFSLKAYSAATGSMEAKRPWLPRSANFTRPVTLAKRVSSEPIPTLRPGLILVPR